MADQLILPVALALLLGACGTTNNPADDAGSDAGSHDAGSDDAGSTDDSGGPAVDAGDGVCCPVTTAPGCTGGTDEPAGGWATSVAACTVAISGPFQEQVDAHGCTVLVRRTDFAMCGPVDAGP